MKRWLRELLPCLMTAVGGFIVGNTVRGAHATRAQARLEAQCAQDRASDMEDHARAEREGDEALGECRAVNEEIFQRWEKAVHIADETRGPKHGN